MTRLCSKLVTLLVVHALLLLPDIGFGQGAPCTIAVEDFREALRRVSFAVGAGTSRYALNGVLAEADQTSLILVATDGSRMAIADAKVKYSSGAGKPARTFLSRTNVRAVQEALDGKSGQCTLEISATQFVMMLGQGKTQLV